MHERVARPAQPRQALEPVRVVPAPLERLGVHGARDQVVRRERDPVPSADLAGRGAGWGRESEGGKGRRWWGCGGGGDVGVEDRGEEGGGEGGGGGCCCCCCWGGGGGEEAVGGQGVGYRDGDRGEEGAGRFGGERVRVRGGEAGGICHRGVGERLQVRWERREDLGGEVLLVMD